MESVYQWLFNRLVANSSRNLLSALLCPLLLAGALSSAYSREFTVPIDSTEQYRHFLARIPAPRGLIVDRHGRTLAYSETRKRVAISLMALAAEKGEENLYQAAAELCGELQCVCPSVKMPDTEDLEKHFENRPFIPFFVSGMLPKEEADAITAIGADVFPATEVVDVFTRIYPESHLTAHIVGYVGRSMPDQHGPYGREESLFPTLEGRHGLELSFEKELSGEYGILSLLYDKKGNEVHREILHKPVPGKTIVASINLDMQRLAYDQMVMGRHNGAFVAMDSGTGDILAMVTYPSYDPNEFVPVIDPDRFKEITEAKGSPFFDRAVSGVYPPGSTFKPIIALAGLDSHIITPRTRFAGPPGLFIDGHLFRNWNPSHEGILDVKFALLRSCNTWFYQAALTMRDGPIVRTMNRFQLGQAPDIPLQGVSAGYMPKSIPYAGLLANVSIGQGDLLVSPLQMAICMTGFANRGQLALPRLVLQSQEPLTGVVAEPYPERIYPMGFDMEAIETVRDGMWGVVNSGYGTGSNARLYKPYVFGKTGTAQWTQGGHERRLAWFTGFADAENPSIAFAVLSEGAIGESMAGGSNSAPLAGRFLRTIYQQGEEYMVSVPEKHLSSVPNLSGRIAPIESPEGDGFFLDGVFFPFEDSEKEEEVPTRRRGLFSRIFGPR